MKRLALAAVVLSALAFGGSAHATCSGTATSAGVSDVFHTQIDNIKLDIRTIGSPLTVGQPPATAVGVCSDGSAGPARGMHFLITDTTTNATLCDMWTSDMGGYDPFGFGTVLGAGITVPSTRACGVAASWDPVGYATGVVVNQYDATRLRFPVNESDAYGTTAGLGIGAIITGGKIWWTTGSGVQSITGDDVSRTYYARGAGTANWLG